MSLVRYVLLSLVLGFTWTNAGITPVYAADEIQYGTIAETKGDSVLLQYKGPGGTEFFSCSLTTNECENRGEEKPNLLPEVLGDTSYTKNNQGTLAIKQLTFGTASYYLLFDISGPQSKRVGLIPHMTPAETIRFSPSGKQIVFISNASAYTYDTITKTGSTITLSQTDLPFFSISYNGTYISTYHYGEELHRIWNTKTGTEYLIGSSAPSYVEFSHDESQLAYLDMVSGYKTLFVIPANALGNELISAMDSSVPVQITSPKTVVEDYLFVGNTLFYMANPENPLHWNLYSYNVSTKEKSLIDEDVSYGDFLKRVGAAGSEKLAYLKVEGKNTNIHTYDPAKKASVQLEVVEDSAAADIKRTTVKYGNTYGALLEPKTRPNGDLFVWLHGGPQRQVAVGYHPYLSYAVYDELLERLVSAGYTVLKLDYTGSTGYGEAFQKALHMQIGVADVEDVENAIEEIKDDRSIKNVYLIGNSYGGYLALKTIVEIPGEVKGAVSINGVTDWYGLISRIPSSPFKALFEGVPGDNNLEAYNRASVFTGLEDLNRNHKILVAYGEEDATVPTWQSTQYMDYVTEKDAEVDAKVDVISFPGEDHILRSRDTLDKLCSKVKTFLRLKKVSCEL